MKLFIRFSTRDLILIGILAAIGLAIKPIVSPISKAISAPLLLPGGSFAGGFYMMWMVLAVMLTGKPGAGTLFGVIQAVVVLVQGSFGNHGALSLLTYTVPGIIVDAAALILIGRSKLLLLNHLVLTALANMTGAFLMSVIIFRHPLVMVLVSLCTALASGIVGGYLSWFIDFEITKLGLNPNKDK
ncbi:MAG TPA: ECF transporter S component [Candidatus Cloacimonadota bacterium]|nr:ECF transporter S component [Candidatus Cloacimonadota bacterium]